MTTNDDDQSPNSPSGGSIAVDPSLRDRVADAAAEFDRCFGAVAVQPTPQNMDALRAAADRLMRACARVLMELGKSERP